MVSTEDNLKDMENEHFYEYLKDILSSITVIRNYCDSISNRAERIRLKLKPLADCRYLNDFIKSQRAYNFVNYTNKRSLSHVYKVLVDLSYKMQSLRNKIESEYD